MKTEVENNLEKYELNKSSLYLAYDKAIDGKQR